MALIQNVQVNHQRSVRPVGVRKKPVLPLQFGLSIPPSESQRMSQLAQTYPVVSRMFELIDIPSATHQPEAPGDVQQQIAANLDLIKNKVVQRLKEMGVTDAQIEHNPLGSLIVRIPGTKGYEAARPLMLTAHMDIVAGNRQNPTQAIQRRVQTIGNKEFITSDGTTTLGADDKGGLAMILENISRLRSKPHVPLEIILSPDEESSCDSLRKLDTSAFKAKHVIVVDEFYAFQATTGLASSVNIKIDVKGTKGGHSGENIGDKGVMNAIELLDRITRKVKTGVIEWHPQYPHLPLISKNLGLKSGGEASNAIPETASAFYLLRSFDTAKQNQEIERIKTLAKNFENRHKPFQPKDFKVEVHTEEDYPAWQAEADSILPGICQKASAAMKGPQVKVEPTHAAAQASILANKTNARGEKFDAVLVGPNIEEAHTKRERIDWQSLVQADQWLGHIIDEYTRLQAKKS